MPKGLIRAAGALLTALALYSLLGFLILPGIALRIANQQLANYATVPARIERIELNPFSLEVTAWGLQIGEPGKEQVGFERLYANLQIDSLWTRALHLADVQLEGLGIRIGGRWLAGGQLEQLCEVQLAGFVGAAHQQHPGCVARHALFQVCNLLGCDTVAPPQ